MFVINKVMRPKGSSVQIEGSLGYDMYVLNKWTIGF